MESLRRRLEASGKANNELKSEVETLREQLTQSSEKLDAAEKKATTAEQKATSTEQKLTAAEKKQKESDATIERLVEREMALEKQVGEAQRRTAEVEKEKQAVEAELATWKAKYKDVVKQGKGAILGTEEALKAQIKIVFSRPWRFKIIGSCK
ncbi:stress response protein NST1-like [Arachis stenosperma]|uniref:stress response protein NST1-like n=1 Tax=Arachis stenosperma TaxID=217475 RepID=UPI0025AB9EE4|nr:stress response protein NST1-like [Arachis stenosperma]